MKVIGGLWGGRERVRRCEERRVAVKRGRGKGERREEDGRGINNKRDAGLE